MQVGKLNLRSLILAKNDELRSLEALASNLKDSRVEIRVEIVGKSGKPKLLSLTTCDSLLMQMVNIVCLSS